MALRSFDPTKVSVIYGPHIVDGFAEGSMISVAFNADFWNLSIGVRGAGSRARTSNRSARVTMSLQQTSPSNDLLTAFFEADAASPVGAPLPFMLKDQLGTTLMTTETMWITKYPDVGMSDTIQSREWVLETDALVAIVGGNSITSA